MYRPCRYGEGLVGSVDAKVRPFDSDASGTVFGDAVGAVVLKRLEVCILCATCILSIMIGAGCKLRLASNTTAWPDMPVFAGVNNFQRTSRGVVVV